MRQISDDREWLKAAALSIKGLRGGPAGQDRRARMGRLLLEEMRRCPKPHR